LTTFFLILNHSKYNPIIIYVCNTNLAIAYIIQVVVGNL